MEKLNFDCYGLEVFEDSICYKNHKYTYYFDNFKALYKECKLVEALGYKTRVSCCDKWGTVKEYI